MNTGMIVQVVDVDEGDLPALASLYRNLVNRETDPERMVRSFRAMKQDGKYILLAAKDGRDLIGSVMGVVCWDLIGECRPFAVMENMVVAENKRRSGIGRLLLERLEQRAAALGCYYVEFVSSRERREAHAFYEAVGYERDQYRGFKKYLSHRTALQPDSQRRCEVCKTPQ